MKSATRIYRALSALALGALFATSAFGQVTSRFVVPGGVATSTKVVQGGSFAMDFRVDAPTTATIGASFLIRQEVPAAPSGYFQITARDFTASIYNDTASGTSDTLVLALPSALLNPTNDDNLGRNTIGLVGAATGSNMFVEKITFSVDPATPFGTYTIKPTPGGASAVTDTAFNDYDMALTASFDVTVGQTLTVTKSGTGTGTITGGGINCGTTCSDIYPGTLVTLTATAAPGSTFIGWSGSGCSGTGTCAVTVSLARTVNAQFDLGPQTLTVSRAGLGTGSVTSAPAGINCGATCSFAFPAGTSVTLTATPAAGSTFSGWSGGSPACSGTGTCTVPMNSAQSVTATFNQQTFNLAVTKSGTGIGTLTSAPAGITCGASCTAPFVSGTIVTLTAVASAGSTFTGWSGGGCSGTGTCVVTVSAATTVNAQFDLNPQTLTVIRAGAGTGTVTSAPAGINCGVTCSFAFPGGTSVTLTATPAAGSVFSGWSGGGCSGTGTCTVTMNSAQNVTATFNQTFNLTVTKSGTGTGTVTSAPAGITCGATCTAPFVSGTIVTLTAVASAGSTFTGWSGGGCSGTGTCVVTVSAASTVNAQFTLVNNTLNVIVVGPGNVTSVPAGINCPVVCSIPNPGGTAYTLTAIASPGATFAGWSGGGCAGTGTCFMINGDVTATFIAIPPALVSAASRKVHGAAGTFDLPLSLVPTAPTIEPRLSTTATVVMTFNVPIISATASVTEGAATTGALTFVGNNVVVPLANVADRNYATVTLTNVASASATGGTASARIGFLVGDVNQNGVVLVSDLALVNTQLSQLTTAANYLKDVNASGTISVADKGLTNANLSQGLPPP